MEAGMPARPESQKHTKKLLAIPALSTTLQQHLVGE